MTGFNRFEEELNAAEDTILRLRAELNTTLALAEAQQAALNKERGATPICSDHAELWFTRRDTLGSVCLVCQLEALK